MGDARPYASASDESVRAGGWRLLGAHTEDPLPDWIPVWDMSQALRIRRQLDVDVARVRDETRLPQAGALAVSVLVTSEFEYEVYREEVRSEDVVSFDIDVEVSGSLLGGSVVLTTSLVLANDVAVQGAPAATRRGSVLWEEQRKVRLYGDASQFPLMETDFAQANLDPTAPWYVQVDPDLELPAMGAITLLLNERFPLVGEAARDFETGRADLKVIRSMLFVDVARTLTEVALSHEDIMGDWPDESLGDVLSTLLRSHFVETPHELRQKRDLDPSAWSALVEGRFGLLREPLR